VLSPLTKVLLHFPLSLLHTLLCARRDWPRRRGAAEQRDEIATFQLVELHSISTSRRMQDIELAMVNQRVYDHALAKAKARLAPTLRDSPMRFWSSR
jgi:hypothetical protein